MKQKDNFFNINDLQKGIQSDLKLYANDKNQEPKELPTEKEEEDIFKDVGEDTLLAAASGTGFFINKSGVLVSNNHVIDSCDKNFVFYDGESFEAKVLGVFSIINRSVKKLDLNVDTYSLLSLEAPLYKESEIPDFLKKTPISKPGSRFLK